MLMEVALDVNAPHAPGGDNYKGSKTEVTETPKAADRFLDEYPTAKIIVVIDTHCIENGYLVWGHDAANGLLTCSMLEVG
jgi:hypothetical protein